MNKFISRLFQTVRSYGESALRRFPATSFMITAFSLMNIIFVLTETENDIENVEIGVCFGCIFALCMEIAGEYVHRLFRYVTFLAPLVSAVMAYVLHRTDSLYVGLVMGGLFTATFIMIFFCLYSNGNGYDKPVFSHMVKSAFLCSVFAGILFAGLTVCIAAFSLLIIGTEEMWKAVMIAGIITHMFFASMLFISQIPEKEGTIEVPGSYRAIIHKGLFYIYLLLIGILYLYIVKTIVTWHMPVGRFNWFGCFSLLFFIFFSLSVDEKDGKIQQSFKKYGAVLLIPVIIMQGIGLGIRISAYGITTLRFASIVLIVTALLFIVCMLVRIPLRLPFAGAAVIALIVTCTPFNLINVPIRNQENILRRKLTEAGALTPGGSTSTGQEKINDSVTIDDKHMKKIVSAYDYLDDTSYIDSLSDKSGLYNKVKESAILKQIQDYKQKKEGYSNRKDDYYDGYEYFTYNSNNGGFKDEEIDISDYRIMVLKEDGDSTKYEDVDLTDFFLSLKEDDKDIRYEHDDFCIIFTWIYYSYKGNDLRDISWSGYVLKK